MVFAERCDFKSSLTPLSVEHGSTIARISAVDLLAVKENGTDSAATKMAIELFAFDKRVVHFLMHILEILRNSLHEIWGGLLEL